MDETAKDDFGGPEPCCSCHIFAPCSSCTAELAKDLDTAIDRKFMFHAVSINGNTYTEDDGVVFLAKDNAFPATLRFYRAECERLGADGAQLKGIDLLIERVDAYRTKNPYLCKVADVAPKEAEELLRPNN